MLYWCVKINLSQPLVYAAIPEALLLVRVAIWLRHRSTGRASSPVEAGDATGLA